MEPITRQEQLLNSIATGDSAELEPITREEMYLSAIAGSTESKPEKPITRKEMFYEKIIESGGVGGGGGGTAKPEQTKTIEVTENGTYKITPDSGKVLSSATAKVNVPERYEEGFQAGVDSVKLQEKTATENGDVLPDAGFSGMAKVTVAVPVKEEQEKSITITENGTTEVTPDEGKTLSKVIVETSVSGGGEVGKPYIDTSKMTDFSSFVKNNKKLAEDVDKLDVSNGTNFSYMFMSTSVEILPPLNTAKGSNFKYFAYDCKSLKEVQSMNIGAATDIDSFFHECSNLETLYFTADECTRLSTNKVFQLTNCKALKNITIPKNFKSSIYVQYSSVITTESLHGMIENLADLTGQTAKTFQVGATNLAKIDEEHIAMLQAKNWNYS